MAEFNVGRVYADILPDLKGFKAAIEAEAKKLKVTVPVEFKASKAQLSREVKRASAGAKVVVPVEFKASRAQLNRVVKTASAGLKINPGIDIKDSAVVKEAATTKAQLKAGIGDIKVDVDVDYDRLLESTRALASREEVVTRQIELQEDLLRNRLQILTATDKAALKQLQVQNKAIGVEQGLLTVQGKRLAQQERIAKAAAKAAAEAEKLAAAQNVARQPRLDAFERALVSTRTKLRGLRDDLSSFDAFATRVARRTAFAFTAAVAGITVAFGAMTAAAVRSFAEVEHSANRASQVFALDEISRQMENGADVTEAAALRINRAIREDVIAASLDVAKVTIFDTAEIAESAVAFAQAGIQQADALEAVATAAKLAQAGDADLIETSNLLVQGFLASGQAASTFGEQAESLGDKLAYTARVSSQNVVQALQAFQNGAASAFSQAGQSVDETLNAIQLLGDVGVQGLTAGTQLSILVRDIGKASSESADAWKKYGVEVVDASGKTRSFAAIADELTAVFDKNAGTNIQRQRDLAKEMGFQFRSFRSLQQLMGAIHSAQADNSSATIELMKLQTQSAGQLELQSRLALDTLSAQFETFRNNASALARVFAGPIARVLTDFFKRLNGFGKEGETLFDRLAVKAKQYGDQVAESLDGFLRRLEGPEGKEFFSNVAKGFKDTLIAVKEFFAEFARGFSDGEGRQRSFMQALGEMAAGFGTLARDVLPDLGYGLGRVVDFMRDHPDLTKNMVKGFIALAVAGKALRIAVLPLVATLTNVIIAINTIRSLGAAGTIGSGLQKLIGDFRIGEGVVARFVLSLSRLRGLGGPIGAALAMIPGAFAEFERQIGPVSELFSRFTDEVSRLAGLFTDVAAPAIEEFMGKLDGVQGVIDGISEAFSAMGSMITSKALAPLRILGNVFHGTIELMLGDIDGAKSEFRDLGDVIMDVVNSIRNGMLTLAISIVKIIGGIGDIFSNIPREARIALESAVPGFGALTGAFENVSAGADGVIKTLEGLKAESDKVSDSSTKTARAIDGTVSSVAEMATQTATAGTNVRQLGRDLQDVNKGIANTFGGANITRSLRDQFAKVTEETGLSFKRLSTEYQESVRIIREETGNLTGALSAPQVTQALQLTEDRMRENGYAVDGLASSLINASGVLTGTLTPAAQTTAAQLGVIAPAAESAGRRTWEAFKTASSGVKTEMAKTGSVVKTTARELTLSMYGFGYQLGVETAKGADRGFAVAETATKGRFQSWKTSATASAREAVRGVWDAMGGEVDASRPRLEGKVQGLLGNLKNKIMQAKDSIITGFRGLFNFLSERDAIQEKLAQIKADVEQLGKTMASIKKAASDVITAMQVAIGRQAPRLARSLADAVLKLGSVAVRNVRAIAPQLQASGKRAVLAIIAGVRSVIGRLSSNAKMIGSRLAKGIVSEIKKTLTLALPTMLMLGRRVVLAINAGVLIGSLTLYATTRIVATTAMNILRSIVTAYAPLLLIAGFNAVKSIATGMNVAAVTVLYPAARAIVDNIITIIRTMIGRANKAGRDVMMGLYEGMNAVWEGTIKPFIHEIAAWIRANKGPIAYDRQLLRPAGEAIMQGFQRGLQDGFGEIQGFIGEVGPYVAALMDEGAFYDRSAEYLIGNAKLGFDDDFVAKQYFDDLLPDLPLGLHPTVSLADTAAMAKQIADFFGLTISSLYRPGAITTSGNVSQHALGQAADFVGSSSAMTRAATMLSLLIDKVFKQIIWLNSLWRGGKPGFGYVSGHMDHVHAGWVPASNFSLGGGIAGRRAQGGQALPGRTYIINERGPELFVPDTKGQVITNENLRDFMKMMHESSHASRREHFKSGGSMKYFVNIQSNSADPNAVAAQVEARIKRSLTRVRR